MWQTLLSGLGNLITTNFHKSLRLIKSSHVPNTLLRCSSITSLATQRTSSNVLSTIREGSEIEGFTVQEISDVPEFHLKAFRLLHKDTGAQYLHLYREDNNNAFSVGFRTTPFDSTGVPHILEHTTLCGSKKYPCRDPFFKMLNRSLATYMNALTGPDFTLYPFATQNQVDYANLMSIYLDAVFRPQLRESDFRQEGWRLEHENVDDPNSPIIFKGVVFNEMKGALCENQRMFGESLLNNILPSHTYGVISGGDPLHIPELTYEKLKEFHSRYYHPSNARFYSYGNFPLEDHLKYINRTYLEHYGKVEKMYSEMTVVPSEKRWTAERKQHVSCRVDNMAANPQKQSTIAVSYLCSDIIDIQETFINHILSELLVSGPNCPLYKSLVEPNIGSGFSPVTGFSPQTKDTLFAVGLQGINPKDFDWVVDTFDKTIDNVIKEGFEQNNIEAVLHKIELITKHQSADFGLGMLFGICALWNHDGNIIQSVKVNDVVTKFKKELNNNPKFLQEKVEKYFKTNKHRLILSMSPDANYEQKKLELESELLQKKTSNLTPEMKEKIFKEGLLLRKEQDKKEDVSCLPTLKVSDLKKVIDEDKLEEIKYSDIPVQVCVQPTNLLTYFRGVLNTSFLPESLKQLVPLFCSVATKMGTETLDYRTFDQQVQLKSGGLHINSHIAETIEDTNSFEEGILLTSYCLDRNVSSVYSLWEKLFNEIKLDNLQRYETLLKVKAAGSVQDIADNGHLYAMSASAGLVNPSAYRKEKTGGLTYISKLCELVQKNQFEQSLLILQSVAKEILNKSHLRLAVNLSPDNYDSILLSTESFINSLPGSAKVSFIKSTDSSSTDPVKKNGIHHQLALPVSYAGKSVPTVPYTHEDFAPLRVMCTLLGSKYLLPYIREKGGAYGAGANISPAGVVSFFSYRDPNPKNSFEVFDGSVDWIVQKQFTLQDVDEAKLGTFQKIDAPVPPGARGSRKFLYGIDDSVFQKHRISLMNVTYDDIVRVANKYLSGSRDVCEGRVLIGPENKEVINRTKEDWVINNL